MTFSGFVDQVKPRRISSLLSLLVFLALFIAGPGIFASFGAEFSGEGAGTEEDPYVITTVDQLQEIKDFLSDHFVLGNDINAVATAGWNSGLGFEPIGTDANPFSGSLDGRGFVISGLYVVRTTVDNVGLFGYIASGASIEDVGLENITVYGNSNVGGLVGRNLGTVFLCYASGEVVGNGGYIGGLIGRNDGLISESYASGTLSGVGDYVGGLTGSSANTVTNCYADNTVSGNAFYVGGLVGANYGNIHGSHASGSVAGTNYVGGLVGINNNNASISKSYAEGNVRGLMLVGGFVGENMYAIAQSYAFGTVTRVSGTDEQFGGFCGHNNAGSISGCYSTGSIHYEGGVDPANKGFVGAVTAGGSMLRNYWDMDTSLQITTGGDLDQYASGKTTAEMKQEATFVNWNFEEVWLIDEGVTYPSLINDREYTVTYTAAANGSIDGISPQTLKHGRTTREVTAVADEGYRFLEWDDGLTNNPRSDVNITNDIVIEAQFWKLWTLTYTAGANGTVEGPSPQVVDEGGDGEPVTAIPDENCIFVSWSDSVTNNPRIDTNVTDDVTVTAEFAHLWTLTYTVADSSNGWISGTSPQVIINGATGTPVTAHAREGYTFSKWSDGITNNPRTDENVTENITVNALFTTNMYTLLYHSDMNSWISDSRSSQTVAYAQSGSSVQVHPYTGYVFVKWSDGSTANPRIDDYVTRDIEVTAECRKYLDLFIYEPSSWGSYSTTNSYVELAGWMDSPVEITNVVWESDRGFSGSVTMDSSNIWSVSRVNLLPDNNVITVTAYDTETNVSDSITITLLQPTSPIIYIEQPTSLTTYSTTNSTITIGGAVYAPEGISRMTWENDRGGSGEPTVASGTWTAPDINLYQGNNRITVTVYSSSDNASSSSITVTYTPPPPPRRKVANDFNGNGVADLAVYDPAAGTWYIMTVDGSVIMFAEHWGVVGEVARYRHYADNFTYLVPADYTGDKITELGVFAKADDKWYIRTGNGFVVAWGLEWGASGAIPVPGDYDGDTKTDFAVYEPSTGLWKVWTWAGDQYQVRFGWSEAIPVPGDYDGDGRTDFAVYHPAAGNWYVWTWSGSYYIQQFGWSETEPVPADYNGDGRTDLAVYHQASGIWHIITSDGYQNMQFGWSETEPVPADYNGDGRTDLAVYHAAMGNWYIWMWAGDFSIIQWGWPEAIPVRAGR